MRNVIVRFSVLFSVLILSLLVSTAYASVPGTGQSLCFDGAGTNISCPPPDQPLAQDGSYNTLPPSYVDNGDGTIIDLATSLMWQKQDSTAVTNWYVATGTYEPNYNASTQSVCGASRTGGYSDWRVPSKTELVNLVFFGSSLPAIHSLFTGTKSSGYWTATTNSAGDVFAWYVDFKYGAVSNARKDGLYLNSQYVRCVRGPQTVPTLADSGVGGVVDSATGLMWQKGGPPLYDLSYTWEGALNYCQGISDGGFSDWRLPNIKELSSLVDDTRNSPPIDKALFPNARQWKYWSSTTMSNYESYSWVGNFTGIGDAVYEKKVGYRYYARCVRNANAQCTFSMSTASQPIPAAGSTGSIAISASDGNCTWNAMSAPNWLTITAGTSGRGSGTINYAVTANPLGTIRRGNISVGGKSISLEQEAAGGLEATVVVGWNLLGNSTDTNINMANLFNDKAKVVSVWKWIVASKQWAFYSPALSAQQLADYTSINKLAILDTVRAGEGFWVKALAEFNVILPKGNPVTTASIAGKLPSGWNLISVSDNLTPRSFNNALSGSPPPLGSVASLTLTSLWGWNPAMSMWYFYEPQLDNSGGLANYAISHGYGDFGTRTLSPTAGFWVNKP
jgi:hypothetical protein